jgi:2-polyprenyl-6-methoxyphenol hydroxylase-like FAD-dependent oxidoreductase
VAALPNVTVRPGVAVSGLLPAGPDWTAGPTGPVGPRIGGGVLERGEPVPADLVVDCSGRGSRSDRWLAALGLPVPEVVEVKVGVGYATRLVRRTASSARELEGGQAMLLLPTPPAEKRVGLVLPIEGDRWLVSVGGWHGDHARDGADGFLSFARELPHPAFAAVAGGCEPLTGVATFRFPSSRRRLFERLRRPPAGYLALGDAVCSFNPIYGQGMTCAVLDARALRETLDRHPTASAAMVRDFYRAAAKVISTPWRFAVGGDFAFPETTGPRPRAVHLLNRYSRRVQLAARVSPEVRRAFTGVQQLVLPPSALFAPPVLARVLRGAIAK